jgi:hypothetical protein
MRRTMTAIRLRLYDSRSAAVSLLRAVLCMDGLRWLRMRLYEED